MFCGSGLDVKDGGHEGGEGDGEMVAEGGEQSVEEEYDLGNYSSSEGEEDGECRLYHDTIYLFQGWLLFVQERRYQVLAWAIV